MNNLEIKQILTSDLKNCFKVGDVYFEKRINAIRYLEQINKYYIEQREKQRGEVNK